ncbi:MAG: hypothetical protein H6744_08305 [Deltaproteobacteria bacterium]|nr:hypothetical protein [Deltaproteobacteria bacterium]MCB9786679.1 hypothetical protein [Deltaproteobacteria bacterium]
MGETEYREPVQCCVCGYGDSPGEDELHRPFVPGADWLRDDDEPGSETPDDPPMTLAEARANFERDGIYCTPAHPRAFAAAATPERLAASRKIRAHYDEAEDSEES